MGTNGRAAPGGIRGRVVMVVDTDVRTDSRVQKAARSAADAGWDVVLLGRAHGDLVEEFNLGQARVRLLPTPPPSLGGPGHEPRLASLRRKLKAGLKGKPLTRVADRAYTAFWQAVLKDRCWRRLEPHLWDFERSYGPVIDQLMPDLIHAHDFRMIGVGARAAQRARAAGRSVKFVWDAHEFLPGLKPWRDNAHWLPAHCAYEREYIPYADAAITVSDGLAELLQQVHNLAERPRVVLNAPAIEADSENGAEPVPDLRAHCGIDSATPLMCFTGAITPVRGVDLVVESLPALTGMHLALVSLAPDRPVPPYVEELLTRAAVLGVADRIHLLPYVPYYQVARYLSTADLAVSPLIHLGNHEIALSNKFFDYSHARLPVVVSDVKTMAETVRGTGQGEVFRAGDGADFIRAVRAVLADLPRYRVAYDRPGLLESWTWEAQARVLDDVYSRLLPDRRSPDATPDAAAVTTRTREFTE